MTRAVFRDILLDKNGRPLDSVTVNVYDQGTTDAISETIYSGPTGATTLANPFTTSDLGEVEFWLDSEKEVDVKYSKSGFTAETKTVKVIREGGQGTTVATSDDITWTGGHVFDSSLRVPEYTEALLPAGATDGDVARITDGARGLVLRESSQWNHLTGGTFDLSRFATLDGSTDDSDDFEDLITNIIPDRQLGFNTDGGGVAGIPHIEIPPGKILKLTRQLVIPTEKIFTLSSPSRYGARIDYTGTTTRSDGTTTASSTTFTAAGASFTADDVGKEIIIHGADVGGQHFVTWIAARTSGTEVTLGEAAPATVANATFSYGYSVFRRDHGGTQSVLAFRGIVFHGGGIVVSSSNRTLAVDECSFLNTEGPAITCIDKNGAGSVAIHLDLCEFRLCRGSFWNQASTYSVSSLRRSAFRLNKASPILLDTTGFMLDDLDFERIDDTLIGHPMIHLRARADATGHIHINKTRFGNEESTGYAAAREPIVVGALDTPSQIDSKTAPNIRITNTEFFGASSGASNDKAKHAIKCNKQPQQLVLIGNHFRQHNSYLISEDWRDFDVSGVRDQVRADNWFDSTNGIESAHVAGVFSHGGVGWLPKPIAHSFRGRNARRRTQNLLVRSNKFDATWIATNCTLAKDATGPNGDANEAWTVTRSGSGSAHVRQNVTGLTVGTPLVVSVYAKKGTHDRMVLTYQATGINGTDSEYRTFNSRAIHLTDDWERYEVPVGLAPSTAGTVWIYHDVVSSSETTGTILIAHGQLEEGDTATPHCHSGETATKHVELPFNGLVLGTKHIGYGTSEPASGRYEVGDIVVNVSPSAGQPSGWMCVSAGSPGTWEPLSVVDLLAAANTWSGDQTFDGSVTVSVSDGLVFGSGTALKKHLQVSTTIDFPSISAHSTADEAVTVTGATTTDVATVHPHATLEAGLIPAGIVSAADEVTVRLANVTAGAIDPANRTWRINVWGH